MSASNAIHALVAGNNLIAGWVDSGNTSGVNVWGDVWGIGLAISLGGSTGGGGPLGCCPPDPSLMRMLQQISFQVSSLTTLVNTLETDVTLIQRQAAPFGYSYQTVASNRQGNGTFTVSGILGVNVLVTTKPSRLGVVVGQPETLYQVGWIRWCTADGCAARLWIDTDNWLNFGNMNGVYTSIQYSLLPGVVVTIQGLVHEP